MKKSIVFRFLVALVFIVAVGQSMETAEAAGGAKEPYSLNTGKCLNDLTTKCGFTMK